MHIVFMRGLALNFLKNGFLISLYVMYLSLKEIHCKDKIGADNFHEYNVQI